MGLGDAVLVQLGADLRLVADGAQGVDPGGAQAEGSGGQEDVLHRAGGVLDAVGVALIVGDQDDRLRVVVAKKEGTDPLGGGGNQLFQRLDLRLIGQHGEPPGLQVLTAGGVVTGADHRFQQPTGDGPVGEVADAVAVQDGLKGGVGQVHVAGIRPHFTQLLSIQLAHGVAGQGVDKDKFFGELIALQLGGEEFGHGGRVEICRFRHQIQGRHLA